MCENDLQIPSSGTPNSFEACSKFDRTSCWHSRSTIKIRNTFAKTRVFELLSIICFRLQKYDQNNNVFPAFSQFSLICFWLSFLLSSVPKNTLLGALTASWAGPYTTLPRSPQYPLGALGNPNESLRAQDNPCNPLNAPTHPMTMPGIIWCANNALTIPRDV